MLEVQGKLTHSWIPVAIEWTISACQASIKYAHFAVTRWRQISAWHGGTDIHCK